LTELEWNGAISAARLDWNVASLLTTMAGAQFDADVKACGAQSAAHRKTELHARRTNDVALVAEEA